MSLENYLDPRDTLEQYLHHQVAYFLELFFFSGTEVNEYKNVNKSFAGQKSHQTKELPCFCKFSCLRCDSRNALEETPC